jgi:uncharacterized membrane protein
MLTFLGTMMFLAVTSLQWSGPAVSLAWIIWLVPIVALSRPGRPVGYPWHALILAAAITLRWLIVDGVQPLIEAWSETSIDQTMPIVNLIALGGILLAAIVLAIGPVARSLAGSSKSTAADSKASSFPGPIIAWAGFILFALFNFEIWRTVDCLANRSSASLPNPPIVKQVAMSVLWAAVGFAAIIIGFRKRLAPLRYAALTLLTITTAKILLVDMAEVQAVWRILSFVAVGGLLLCVSYVYHRQVQAQDAQQSLASEQ